MIRIDSIKIEAPNDILSDIDISCFDQQIVKDTTSGQIKSNLLKLKDESKKVGLNSILINEKKNTVIMTLSSKILKENYFELININTVGQVFDEINKTGIIKIDDSQANNIIIHSADFTTNLKGTKQPKDYIQALQLMSLNSNYIVTPYTGTGQDKNKNGIVFRGRQKSFKERCIMYHKFDEIIKDKDFIKSLKSPLPVVNSFKDILRMENNITSHKKIREYTLTDNNLMSVLNSTAILPNYKLFKKIKNLSGVQTDLFNYDPDIPFNKIRTQKGDETIIKELNFDMSLIRELIQKHVKGKVSNYIKDFRKTANDMLNNKDIAGQSENDLINEFENLLKVA